MHREEKKEIRSKGRSGCNTAARRPSYTRMVPTGAAGGGCLARLHDCRAFGLAAAIAARKRSDDNLNALPASVVTKNLNKNIRS